jgi:hypothetical protein
VRPRDAHDAHNRAGRPPDATTNAAVPGAPANGGDGSSGPANEAVAPDALAEKRVRMPDLPTPDDAITEPADALAPLPLDGDLPHGAVRSDPLGWAWQHRRGVVWVVAGVALALRALLLPLGHPWDITTMYNTFVDLGHNTSPYATMRDLTDVARAAMWRVWYEYYAYPPGPIYLYYPLAQLFHWLRPAATYFFAAPGSVAMPRLPWDFYVFYKVPIWAADFGIAAVLARMTGTVRAWRDYLLNPYVLLISGAWTFDAVMVLGLVLGVYWLQRGRLGWAAAALAVGTMVKFIPAFIVPTCALYLIKRRRHPREVALFLGVYLAVCLALFAPFARGTLYILGFQGGRYGGGMNFQVYWTLWRLHPDWVNTTAMQFAAGAFGTPALILALLLAYWYVTVTEMPLSRMVVVTLLAYLIGTKLVNEQYVLALFPFTLIEARRLGGAWRWLHHAFWLTALAFAIMHVPIDHFLWPLYHTVFGARADVIATTGITGLDARLFPWNNERIQPLAVLLLGGGFTALCVAGLVWPGSNGRGSGGERAQSAGARPAPELAVERAAGGRGDRAPKD